ncbi:type I phosphomannose isomerase catalytic subunit [Fusibacter sp. JL216-2]|uniref:type I phosphomannose isomerase catalytic subunit n=1 Tax=Fusibacter sp. JL216-2 TaxID=3071453 RepID=UPI003D356947
MYPFKFESIYLDKVWGGQSLKDYKSNIPEGLIGESWDISTHPVGVSNIKNGYMRGQDFKKLILEKKESLVGKVCSEGNFPLLVKMISAADNLSVQVHPDDIYALRNENSLGKTEAWYILDADQDAHIILGMKDCSRDEFNDSIKSGVLLDKMNKIPVASGELYFVESGLVHAIGSGITLIEIQQSSDITYRVYDYGRGRDLHVEQALDVINFSKVGRRTIGETYFDEDTLKINFVRSAFFNIDKLYITDRYKSKSNPNSFRILTCVDGSGKIFSEKHTDTLRKGESVLIPASMGEFAVEGQLDLLDTWID